MKPAFPPQTRQGSALLIILACVTLVTVLVISLLMMSRFEQMTSNRAFTRAQTEAMADYAADVAIGRLREAIDSGRTFSPGGYSMWASEPGRIHVVNVSTNGIMLPSSRDMFSALPGPDDSSLAERQNVDLNKAKYSRNRPITGSQPGTMKVGWINLLADPGQPAGKNNPIVGRVAYWVDDESCKVNVNTADGSQKYTKDSFGFGTPSEINLQALPSGVGSDFLSKNQAAAISQYAWNYGFNSALEVERVAGIPGDFYETNKFNLTAFNSAPEVTFFGEPRIYLFPTADTTSPYADYTRSANSGPYLPYDPISSTYAFSGPYNKGRTSDVIDFIYPTATQLPLMQVVGSTQEPLLQFAPRNTGNQLPLAKSNPNYHFAARIARAIQGHNSQGTAFAWPAFPNSTPGAFAAKYNLRQIDSIALHILDAAVMAPSVNQAKVGYNYPSLVAKGMLSGEMAIGIGRTPKLTELEFSIDAFSTDVAFTKPDGTMDVPQKTPGVQVDMKTEFYLPVGFAGDPLWCWDFRVGNEGSISQNALNQNDHCGQYWDDITTKNNITWPAPMGGYWDDQLLSFMNGNNPSQLAGIDLRAHSSRRQDPEYTPDPSDSDKSTIYHPYTYGKGATNFNSTSYRFKSPLQLYAVDGGPLGGTPADATWQPGRYHGSQAANKGGTDLYASRNVQSFLLTGGATVWGRDATGAAGWETVPLDSFRNSAITGENPASIISLLKQAVIPVPPNFLINLGTSDNVWHARVADPLVNKFPKDWIISANPPPEEVTLNARDIPAQKSWGGTGGANNPEYLPENGGDPLSIWLPRQDVTYPKQSRFPSIGALNYLRTGVIPDDLTVPLPQQKGTPWRTINLSPAGTPGQTITVNGISNSYPDWAMLDLFTVPFTPQKPYLVGETPQPRRILTHGGATEGKLNINNPRIPYPFGENVPGVSQNPPVRTAPLDALFLGVRTSISYQASGKDGFTPDYVTVDESTAASLRDAVQNYFKSNGPFLLAGQLAEVPMIDTYTYKNVVPESQSRNDLMREVVGAITTQSNIFSIWVVTQSIRKKPGNPNPGIFEPGDTITGETRRRYLVERLIETGLDGAPGNPVSVTPPTTNDGVVGTADDPVNTRYHPAFGSYPLPYRWRILSITEVAS